MRRSFALTSAMLGPENCRSEKTQPRGGPGSLTGAEMTVNGVASIRKGYMDRDHVERLGNDVFLSPVSLVRSDSFSPEMRFALNPDYRRESHDDQARQKDARFFRNRQTGCAHDPIPRHDRKSSFKTPNQSRQKDAVHAPQKQH